MTAALAYVERPPLRAAIYCRISLDATGEAQGVERQEQACRELVDREGWTLVEPVLVDNDISAYSGKRRPDYERLLDLVRRGAIDAIVAYHPDRLYRRLADLSGLTDLARAAKCEVRTVAAGLVDLNTASGRFTAQVLGAAAEHEAARLGERVSMKHTQNAERGKAHGGWRSYGYDRPKALHAERAELERELQDATDERRAEIVDRLGAIDAQLRLANRTDGGEAGELVINPAEAEAIREAAQRILRGATLSSIVVDWNERGIRTATGVLWRPGTLSKVMRSGRIAGLREGKNLTTMTKGSWEPILDEETWARVKSRITHAPVGRRPRSNLLASMCRCGRCGATMGMQTESTTKQLRPGQREPRRMIACDKTNRHGCGSNTVKADEVEKIVLAHVFEALKHTNLAQARARRTIDSSKDLYGDIAKDKQLLEDYRVAAVRDRMGPAEYLAMTEDIRARIAENERKLDEVAADSDLTDDNFEGVTPERWKELDIDTQRRVVRVFVDHVEIAKGKPGRTFDQSRVHVVAHGEPCSCPSRLAVVPA